MGIRSEEIKKAASAAFFFRLLVISSVRICFYMNQDCFDIEFEGSHFFADARVNGNIKSEKAIRLDGFIEGEVWCAKQIVINKSGVVDGNVECGELYINGRILGDVRVAGKTVMGASAEITGRLTTGSLEITPGAKIGKGLKLKKA